MWMLSHPQDARPWKGELQEQPRREAIRSARPIAESLNFSVQQPIVSENGLLDEPVAPSPPRQNSITPTLNVSLLSLSRSVIACRFSFGRP